MKVASLHAEQVHGYLPIDVEFSDDLTFLIGLNGSGKTSALRLLMALLTPNIDELGSISFSVAAVTIHDGSDEVIVKAQKTIDNVTLSVSSLPDALVISSADLELYMDVRRRDEPRSPILEKYQLHPIFQRIKAISTPMFLGLDRRFYAPGTIADDMNEVRRREYMARRYWPEDATLRGAAVAALVEVNYLVVTRMQEVRAAQEQLDERLRAQFFTKAFEYKPSDVMGKPARLPSRTELERYRQQLLKIEIAAEGVKIPVPEIQTALTHFFERMSIVIESLDKSTKAKRPGKKSSKKPTERSASEPRFPDKDYFEWIINKPQADRILEHLKLLDEYIENRNALRDPISRFLSLVNGFLVQTKKNVSVGGNGQLTVSVQGFTTPRPISALSSGERQLLVMLAHLSLNPNLVGSGVFIVDEPELSLHIDWQEKFVDAIREANPKVQLILATHSPAIILDRTDSCRALSEAIDA
jgi:energy-coupling factor transporter ATP-binding protein EcfA2